MSDDVTPKPTFGRETASRSRQNVDLGDDLVRIPAQTTFLGSDEHYPEERPAHEVTVDGFMARDYKSNGFFFTNLTGYTMNHLIARRTGVYGLYAFNTIGGRMMNSEAYYANDGAFYIGQTPPQTKPIRSIVFRSSVRNVPM